MSNEQPNPDSKEEAAPSPEWNGADWTLKVNGAEVVPESRDDLVRWAQMGHDYTQKTQQLAEEKQNFSRLVEERALAIYKQALAEQGQQPGSQEPQDDDDPIGPIRKEMEELKGQLSQFNEEKANKEADAELDAMLNTLHGKYEGLSTTDEKVVLIRFNEQINEQSDAAQLLDQLFAERVKEKQAERQAVIDDYVKTKSKDPFASGETGSSGSPASDLNKEPTTFNEARARADARLRAQQGL